MSDSGAAWDSTISVRAGDLRTTDALERALRPEAMREVPRAHAMIDRPEPTIVRLTISARDAGAMRAALNTYLGWIHLALATREAARPGGAAGSPRGTE
jgi:tRNA threonylcarbamoyladenosine modification (KEOPS) complex  Pcc1 subunit